MDPSVLVILATVVIFVVIVVAIRTLGAQKTDQRTIRRQHRGFALIESPAESLVHRILTLQPNQDVKIHITRISQKRVQDGELYLFDAMIPKMDTNIEDDLVCISPLLHLPRFVLFPLPNLDGKWGNLMNDLVGNVTGWAGSATGLQRMHLTEFPEWDRKFTLLVADENDARAFFDVERVRSLTALDPSLAVYAVGDSFQITTMHARGKNADELLDLQMTTAMRLLQMLRS